VDDFTVIIQSKSSLAAASVNITCVLKVFTSMEAKPVFQGKGICNCFPHGDIVCQNGIFRGEVGLCSLNIFIGFANDFFSGADGFFIVFAIARPRVWAPFLKGGITSDGGRFFQSFLARTLFVNDIAVVLECGCNKTALQINLASALLPDNRIYASHDGINCLNQIRKLSIKFAGHQQGIPSSSPNSALKNTLRPRARMDKTIAVIVSDTVN
jgi:hypothetical protein